MKIHRTAYPVKVPLTPHPGHIPPAVEATIIFCIAVKILDVHAINDLIRLKSDAVTVEYPRLVAHVEYLRNVLTDEPAQLAAVKGLEAYIPCLMLDYIIDLDEACVAVLRNYKDIKVDKVVKEGKKFEAARGRAREDEEQERGARIGYTPGVGMPAIRQQRWELAFGDVSGRRSRFGEDEGML